MHLQPAVFVCGCVRVQRNGAVSGFIFRKKKSKPPSLFVNMATNQDFANNASNALATKSEKVVKPPKDAKEKKNRMNRQKKDLSEIIERDPVKGPFIKPIEKPFTTSWG
ncbi:hypothetical protein AVEN_84226-1 [Araneus ventricosus]|uniref:Uncharacterized protein n=1 Tax=Araneus ventricosus TaxID=182803 RepID=A0A4Y2L1D0_ARAVE|nr:hypothetical protein AVEN_84226-1 [Araneus ventricosus]